MRWSPKDAAQGKRPQRREPNPRRSSGCSRRAQKAAAGAGDAANEDAPVAGFPRRRAAAAAPHRLGAGAALLVLAVLLAQARLLLPHRDRGAGARDAPVPGNGLRDAQVRPAAAAPAQADGDRIVRPAGRRPARQRDRAERGAAQPGAVRAGISRRSNSRSPTSATRRSRGACSLPADYLGGAARGRRSRAASARAPTRCCACISTPAACAPSATACTFSFHDAGAPQLEDAGHRLDGLRHDHGVSGPLPEPPARRPAAHPERLLPDARRCGASSAARRATSPTT